MARIFVSHSSADAEVATKLASDLTSLGHAVWLDKWAIRVGECIVQSVERGLQECDYLVVLLTPDATKSGWVDREWKLKYWDEINKGQTIVLPVLAGSCEIPSLLRTKKYADIWSNYSLGLVQLSQALPTPADPYGSRQQRVEGDAASNLRIEAVGLLADLSDRDIPLSRTLPKLVRFATNHNMTELAEVSRLQIKGIPFELASDMDTIPPFVRIRVVTTFVCLRGEINMRYLGWNGDPGQIISHMERDNENFRWCWKLVPDGVSSLEDKVAQIPTPMKGILRGKVRLGDINPDAKSPEHELVQYLHPDTYQDVLRAIRADMIQRIAPFT